jgi:PAS domain S-box-containing protein
MRLEEAYEKERALLDTPGNAVIILDGEGKIVSASFSFLEMIDQTRQAGLGRRLADLAPKAMATEIGQKLSALSETPGSFEMTLLGKGGEKIDVHVTGRTVLLAGTPYITASIWDMSAQKSSEAALLAAQKEITTQTKAATKDAAALKAAEAALLAAQKEITAQTQAAAQNAAALKTAEASLLAAQEEITAQTKAAAKDAAALKAAEAALLAAQKEITDQTQAATENAAALKTAEASLLAAQEEIAAQTETAAKDAAALITTEASLSAAREEIKALLAFLKKNGLSIYTQLRSIVDLSQLNLGQENKGTNRDIIEIIKKMAKRLLSVTGNLIEMPTLQAGSMTPSTERFDLERLIGETASLMMDVAAARATEIVIRISPEVPRYVIGDARRLGRILLEGINQAVNYAQDGDVTIHISMAGESGSRSLFRFSVDFNGSLEEQDQEAGAIFKPLVLLLGGETGSETVTGPKSTIWFTLPLGLINIKEQPSQISFAGRRMLVVDANPSAGEALALMLSEQGALVERLTSSKAALEVITAAQAVGTPFEVAFIGQGTKDVEGFEAIIRIRSQFENGKFPHLVLISDGHSPESKTPQLERPILRYRLNEIISPLLEGATPPRQAELDPTTLSGTRVLLVEDSPTDQLVARDMLEAVGINVDTAENGYLAVEMVMANNYEIVLMDVQMPVMGAIEATHRIRLSEAFSRLPIIAMIKEDSKEERKNYLQFGLNDVVFKPVDPDQLYAVIEKWTTDLNAKSSLLD